VGNFEPFHVRRLYHCVFPFRSHAVKAKKPPAVFAFAATAASAKELPELGEREFLTRGAAAGIKARETGVTISTEESTARLRALAAKRAAMAIDNQPIANTPST
jgi:hypothetical protein